MEYRQNMIYRRQKLGWVVSFVNSSVISVLALHYHSAVLQSGPPTTPPHSLLWIPILCGGYDSKDYPSLLLTTGPCDNIQGIAASVLHSADLTSREPGPAGRLCLQLNHPLPISGWKDCQGAKPPADVRFSLLLGIVFAPTGELGASLTQHRSGISTEVELGLARRHGWRYHPHLLSSISSCVEPRLLSRDCWAETAEPKLVMFCPVNART